MDIRIAGFNAESIVDGPGVRFTLFVQGCKHHCDGCHNPMTWSFSGGTVVDTDDIIRMIHANPLIRGVTFSGGDPYEQEEPVLHMAEQLASEGYDLWVYTGYRWQDIRDRDLTGAVDVVVDGPFMRHLRTMESPFIGSSNQRIIDARESIRKDVIVPYRVCRRA